MNRTHQNVFLSFFTLTVMSQLELLWPHPTSPYVLLGISERADIGEIRGAFKRRALETHPDKCGPTAGESFLLVKEAATLLLDPYQRSQYDQLRLQTTVRLTGEVSDSYRLGEDFDLTAEETGYQVYQRECRCGGLYEVIVFEGEKRTVVRCECDCCSLTVEVDLSAS
ncbi:chaperone DnaJ protein [Angomonas deanei]|uniref:DnaJ domain containing protein, putative n=1 Tax=Angomonas deanei TaxID=59799 RepID=S9VDI2_9TRYP|nr:chaperone DnaJ protein [Angomonas deanei]EPY38868.1 chaperone DnaJ protein [Angomonas deanei]EPY42262.1 chaperone DnaJ protein [Angomonas deanei]CAD2222354.1 DnaJ domain containing protein, putative [Angomonas deanei]|eukprot:EPY31080.1 chaperone DnaJ protein [Angomonas deanei]